MRDWEISGYWKPLALVPMGGSLGASELKGDRMALLCGRRVGVQWSAESKWPTADNARGKAEAGRPAEWHWLSPRQECVVLGCEEAEKGRGPAGLASEDRGPACWKQICWFR